MKKIPSLWVRDFHKPGAPYTTTVTPGCEWVLRGEGQATRKFDGTACLVQDGKLFARYDAKRGKTPPPEFIPAQDPDPTTGHWPGWVEVKKQPQYRWHREAWDFHLRHGSVMDGTYELCGPKLQTNAESLRAHVLIRHGVDVFDNVPLDFFGLCNWLAPRNIEGLVFHHADGHMVKVTKHGYGQKRVSP